MPNRPALLRGLEETDVDRLPEFGWRPLLKAHRAQLVARLDGTDAAGLQFQVGYDVQGRLQVRAEHTGHAACSGSLRQLLRTLEDRLLLQSARTCAMCGKDEQVRIQPISIDETVMGRLRRRPLCAGHAYLALSEQVLKAHGLQ